MGNYYVNIAVRGLGRDGVLLALEQLRVDAFVSPAVNDVVVVYPRTRPEEILDHRAQGPVRTAAAGMSAGAGCAALVVTNWDDDLLYCSLFREGKLLVSYARAFGGCAGVPPRVRGPREFARALCKAFGVPQSEQRVRALLTAPPRDLEDEDAAYACLEEVLGNIRRRGLDDVLLDLRRVIEGIPRGLERSGAHEDAARDREKIARLFHRVDQPALGESAQQAGPVPPCCAVELHHLLARELGLGDYAPGIGFDDLERGHVLCGRIEDFARAKGADEVGHGSEQGVSQA